MSAMNSVARVAVLYFMCIAVVVCGFDASAADKKKKEDPDVKFVREMFFKLPQGLFSKADKSQIEKLLKGKNKDLRPRCAALLSMYERLYKDDSVAAVSEAGTFLIENKALKDWKDVNEKAFKDVMATWKTESAEAKTAKLDASEKPTSKIYANFPDTSKWTIDENTVYCAVEIVRAHMDSGRERDAMKMLSAIGKKFTELPRVLSAECGGDLLLRLKQYEQCIEFYGFALKSLEEMRKISEYGNEKREYTKDELFIKRRIEASLAKARRLWDIERYGEGWVLYREGENFRRKDHKYPEAMGKFAEMREKFASTIYDEVAVAHTIKCLLSLADPEYNKVIDKALKEEKKDLTALQTQLRLAKAAKLSEKGIQYFVDEIAAVAKKVKLLEDRPDPQAALKSAFKQAEEMIAANKFGLYRGEILKDLAEYSFNADMDVKKAFTLYTRLWAWLEEVEKVDQDLSKFTVPGKAVQISAPPAEEATFDRMGNYHFTSPDIGDIVNRKTCAWYLDDLREKAALSLGFTSFIKGENEEASKWYEKAIALDKLTGLLDSKGEWNNVKRLRWGAEHGYLYAYPQELKLYKGKQRTAVLLGDFYFCSERFDKAELIFNNLLAGDYGTLTAEQSDYPNYAIGAAYYWTKGRTDACKQYEKVLERKNNTYTEIRAAYALGKLGGMTKDEKLETKGEDVLEQLANSGRNDEFAYRAMIEHAKNLIKKGELKQGMKLLNRVPKKADGYYELAQLFIKRETEKQKQAKEAALPK